MGSFQTQVSDNDIHRALNYPYPWDGQSYLFYAGRQQQVDRPIESLRHNRTPVLAYGSNRSAEQLKRKFGILDQQDAIFVEPCRICGFDIIHSAHITSYGAIPAAIQASKEVTINVAVTWLNSTQLEIMDASENIGITYGREKMAQTITLSNGDAWDDVEVYQSSHGPLYVDGIVIRHSDVVADGRNAIGISNKQLLCLAQQNFCHELSFTQFIEGIIADRNFRDNISRQLKLGLTTHISI